jgi:hypothetical protein
VTKPRRNEPCPCGSGKKYKRCHGTGEASQTTLSASAVGTKPASPDTVRTSAVATSINKPDDVLEPGYVVVAIQGGKQPELPISNLDYLKSYERFGLWMRVLNAYNHMLALEAAPLDGLTRIGSIAGLMEQHGMFMEDVTSIVMVLCAWSKRRDRLIPDLLRGLSIKNGPIDERPNARPYHEVALESLVSRGRGVINPRQFFASVDALSVDAQARLLGIDGPENIGSLDNEDQARWRKFGESISTVFHDVGRRINQLAATAYNKIKHGPQAIVCNMRAVVLQRDAHPSLAELFEPDHLHLRLLFDGARTQETPEDTNADPPKPVAPFLPDDQDNVVRLVLRMMATAASLQPVVQWILHTEFKWRRTAERDPDLAAMLEALKTRITALPPKRKRHEREISIEH